MLRIYDSENMSADIIDIDAEFSRLLIDPDETLNKIIKSVECGYSNKTDKGKTLYRTS